MMVLGDIKRARGVVKKNPGASLVDLGDGVLCLEFHSKMNSLGDDSIAMMYAGARRDGTRNFEAMVIANEGENFSGRRQPDAGAAGRAGGRMGRAERRGESRSSRLNMAMKYAPRSRWWRRRSA